VADFEEGIIVVLKKLFIKVYLWGYQEHSNSGWGIYEGVPTPFILKK